MVEIDVVAPRELGRRLSPVAGHFELFRPPALHDLGLVANLGVCRSHHPCLFG